MGEQGEGDGWARRQIEAGSEFVTLRPREGDAFDTCSHGSKAYRAADRVAENEAMNVRHERFWPAVRDVAGYHLTEWP